MDTELYDLLVTALYEGILAPDGWSTVLQQLRVLTGSEQTVLLSLNCLYGTIAINESYWGDSEPRDGYVTHYVTDGPCKPFIGRISVGNWYFDECNLGQDIIESHPFYENFLSKCHLRSVMWTPLLHAGEAHAMLSFLGGMRRPHFRPEDTKIITPIMPHLIRATNLRWRFQDLSSLAQLGQEMLDRLSSPILVIDHKARILFANAAGQTWLSTKRHPYSYQSKLLQAHPWPQLLKLAENICGAKSEAIGTVKLQEQGDGPPTYIIGLPLCIDHPLARVSTARVGMLVIQDPSVSGTQWSKLLQQLFNLTPAECRLVEKLAEQYSVTQAAAAMGLTRETVRSQLKAVFRKTGIHNQNALARLVTDLRKMC